MQMIQPRGDLSDDRGEQGLGEGSPLFARFDELAEGALHLLKDLAKLGRLTAMSAIIGESIEERSEVWMGSDLL